MASAEGKFVTVVGADDAVLLEDLKKTLEAKRAVKNPTKIPDLALDAVVLGQRQSRYPSGGFSSKPPGDWILTKIFLPKGGDEGEVFFNFNPFLGKSSSAFLDGIPKIEREGTVTGKLGSVRSIQ